MAIKITPNRVITIYEDGYGLIKLVKKGKPHIYSENGQYVIGISQILYKLQSFQNQADRNLNKARTFIQTKTPEISYG